MSSMTPHTRCPPARAACARARRASKRCTCAPAPSAPCAPGKSKPPRTYPAMRQEGYEGVEWKGSTSTGRQLSGPLSRPDLSFAAKHRVRKSYLTCIHTPSALPRVRDTYYRPRVRLASVLRRHLPPHSTGLRPVLLTNVHDCPERSQAG